MNFRTEQPLCPPQSMKYFMEQALSVTESPRLQRRSPIRPAPAHRAGEVLVGFLQILRQGSFKNLPDHLFRIEVFFGQLPGQSALVFVIGGDHVQALGCSLYSLESK